MATTISGTITNTASFGSGSYSSPVTVTSSGAVLGATGVTAAYQGNSTYIVHAGYTGVVMVSGTASNAGRVVGGTGSGVDNYLSATDGAGGTGLLLETGTLTNTGTIAGGTGGYGNTFWGTQASAGRITNGGNGGNAVDLTGGTLINAGTILGGKGGKGLTTENSNSRAGAAGVGVDITGGVFVDSGVINSYGAASVVLTGGNSAMLVVESGASFSGQVSNSDANATLAVGGTTPFVLASIGAGQSFAGFTQLSFASGQGGFGMSGNLAGDTITGFTLSDSLTLTGFAAVSESFASANRLVLTNSSGTSETIDLAGFTNTDDLVLSSNGTNTTIEALVVTIASALSSGVTAGVGNYASDLVITNTGAVTGPAGAAGGSTTSGTAGSTAVLLNAVSDTLTNSGVVTGGAGGSAPSGSAESGGAGGAGVALSAGLLVNAGNITGGAGGAYGYSGGSTGKSGAGGAGVSTTGQATIINSGNISGGQAGVNTVFTHLESSNIGGVGVALSTGSTLMNSGAITGATAATIYSTSRAQAGAAGVSLAGSGQVTNSSSGVITGGTGGGSQNAFFQPGGGGNGGTGLVSGAGETLLNQGHITGGNGGYAWQSSAGNGGTGLSASSGDVITNTGVITGGNGAKEDRFQGEPNLPGANGAGVYLNGGTLINAGTIAGGTYAGQGNAVSFGATAATLVVENGAVFNGNIVANSAVADVLAFAGSSATKFSGIGTSAYNFNHISFASGAAWTIEGNAAGLASGETIAGFTSTDAIILDSFAATSETLVAGKLTLGNGSSFDTLNLGASSDNFVVLNNGTNSTIFSAPASISLAGTYIISAHSAGLSGTSITGFAVGDTIDLEGFAATSETYKSGIGLVLGNGTSFDTLKVNSFTGNFADTTDGTNTTIVAKPLVSIISTHIGGRYSYVTLGNGTYADSLTITSSGVVGHGFGGTDISDTAGQTGITLFNQGVIENAHQGVDFVNAAYVNNSGDINTNLGISLQNGGTIVNTGRIQGSQFGYSVWLNGGTIINAGYIGGNAAIYSNQALTLIEEVGQSSSNDSEVRVASYNGDLVFGPGTGSQDISFFKGFSNISFATGAAWTIDIQPSQNNFDGVTLTGFDTGNIIDLKYFTVESDNFANNVLTVTGQNGAYLFNIAGDFTTSDFTFTSDGDYGTDMTLPCFAAGTRILTPRGDLPVETLRVGDIVITVRDGGQTSQKITWTGSCHVNLARHVEPALVRPIRIAAGAIAPGIPERDLRVSPHHAIYLGGLLFEARALVNGVSIFQEMDTRAVTYHHIELETHDIVLAEGCPSESYLETGLRHTMEPGPARLNPVLPASAEGRTCVPLVLAGPALDAARAAINARTRPQAA